MAKVTVTTNEFFGQGGPLQHLEHLIKQVPKAANAAAAAIGEEIVHKAKAIIDAGDFAGLWTDGAQELYHWTPEFNKKFRVNSRESSHPLIDTGEMRDEIQVLGQTRHGSNASVTVGIPAGPVAERAMTHEHGGTSPITGGEIPARPFLEPAVFETYYDPAFLAQLESIVEEYMEQ